ncbi:MAG: hypothetical protein RIR31_524 [Bacteroidota bacterium]|jgi:hypothetical protein
MKRKQLLFLFAFSFSITLTYAQSLHRDSIVNELQIFKAAIIKGNKERVAALFSFPVTNKELKLKIQFSAEKEIRLSTLDKKAFEKYYSKIITVELINFFNTLDIDKLKRINRITGKFVPKLKSNKNTYTYELIIEQKNKIILQWNANPREDIKMKEEDMPFEYSEIWHFKFINGKLQFNNFFAAG